MVCIAVDFEGSETHPSVTVWKSNEQIWFNLSVQYAQTMQMVIR